MDVPRALENWGTRSLELLSAALANDSRIVAGVATIYVLYVASNWGINRRPSVPRSVRILYNVVISLYSLYYALSLGAAIARHVSAHSLWHATCSPDSVTGELAALYALNVVTRVLEFTDTVFIVHSSHPLTLLHCWHHVATFVLAHVQVLDHTPAQWLTLLVNAWVHVAMYAYYALVASGRRPQWKRAVTVAQIVQFVLILGVYGALFVGRASGRVECYSSPRAMYTGFAILSSYLILFLRFYAQTYGEQRASKQKGA